MPFPTLLYIQVGLYPLEIKLKGNSRTSSFRLSLHEQVYLRVFFCGAYSMYLGKSYSNFEIANTLSIHLVGLQEDWMGRLDENVKIYP